MGGVQRFCHCEWGENAGKVKFTSHRDCPGDLSPLWQACKVAPGVLFSLAPDGEISISTGVARREISPS